MIFIKKYLAEKTTVRGPKRGEPTQKVKAEISKKLEKVGQKGGGAILVTRGNGDKCREEKVG